MFGCKINSYESILSLMNHNCNFQESSIEANQSNSSYSIAMNHTAIFNVNVAYKIQFENKHMPLLKSIFCTFL